MIKPIVRSPFGGALVGWLLAGLIGLLMVTVRWSRHDRIELARTLAAQQGVIAVFWHDRIFAMPYLWPPIPLACTAIATCRRPDDGACYPLFWCWHCVGLFKPAALVRLARVDPGFASWWLGSADTGRAARSGAAIGTWSACACAENGQTCVADLLGRRQILAGWRLGQDVHSKAICPRTDHHRATGSCAG